MQLDAVDMAVLGAGPAAGGAAVWNIIRGRVIHYADGFLIAVTRVRNSA